MGHAAPTTRRDIRHQKARRHFVAGDEWNGTSSSIGREWFTV
jgi:hypothetical protein